MTADLSLSTSSHRPDLYIVFDVLPLKKDGGLVASYKNFVTLFKDDFNIHLVSIFKCEPTDIDEFKNIDIIRLTKATIDNRFFRVANYVKNREFRRTLKALKSFFLFFLSIPICKRRSLRLLNASRVIASSPAASMFLSSKLRYVLEIHTSFDYFWGTNLIGSLQTKLIPPPCLTVFRTRYDSERAEKLFSAAYLYNCANDPHPPMPYDLDQRKNRILFVGRLSEEKNPLLLIKCAQCLQNLEQPFHLDIYGDGPLREQLIEAIRHANLDSCITMKGFVDDPTVYSRYSILWSTSNLEGFPLVSIEAMASMTPVVSTKWGEAIHEVIDESCGAICETPEEIANATKALLSNPQQLQAYAENARKRYEEFFNPKAYRARWLSVMTPCFKDTTSNAHETIIPCTSKDAQ